ncbi:MAG: YhcN/YlaJ family sporulation lipoprotein [Deltaproteobacteria bacterium]
MRNRSQAIIITTLSILLLVVIAFASGVTTAPPNAPKVTPQSQVVPGAPNIPNPIATKTPAPARITKPVLTEAQKRAQKINNQCLKIKGVKDCSTVVAGNSCVIGCKFSKDVKNVNAEKKMIANKIRAMDKSIKSCTVTDSMDAIPRINNLFKSTNANYINSELKKIVNELAPVTR